MPVIINGIITYYSGSKNNAIGVVVESPAATLGSAFIKLASTQVLTRANYPDLSELISAHTNGQVYELAGQLPTSLTNIVYNGSYHVSIKSGKLYYSATGATWSIVNFNDTVNSYTIVYAAFLGLFLAMRASSATYYTSTDGITWTARTFPETPTVALPAWNGYFFCVPSTASTTLFSLDGLSWISRAIANQTWFHLTYLANVFVLFAASTATYYTCADGITWIARTFPITITPSIVLLSANNGSTLVVLLRENLTYYTTQDGINWTTRYLNSYIAPGAIACNGSSFVIFPINGNNFLLSPTAISWSAYPLPASSSTYYGPAVSAANAFLFLNASYTVYRSVPASATQLAIQELTHPVSGLNYFITVL